MTAILATLFVCQGPAHPATSIAAAIAATFDSKARSKAMLPYDSPDRRRWGRSPSERPGVMLSALTAEQRSQVDRLVRTVLSETGFATLAGIRAEQDILGREESGLGADWYWFAIYGEPGRGAWAWRLGGHHVSIHATFSGDALRSVVPLHFGGEVGPGAAKDWKGYARLEKRGALARRLVLSLSGEQRSTARIPGDERFFLSMSEPQVKPHAKPSQGLAITNLEHKVHEDVAAIVREYLSAFQQTAANQLMNAWHENGDEAHIAFYGSPEGDEPFYFRLQTQDFLIESSDTGKHLHTIVRTASDFGG